MEEKNLYYYHPDHLGSSSYITDKNGETIQHTEYIAFGEVLVDEHSTTNKMPYLFNGKELDYETGLYYYGARYYDPKVSIFLNVDPLVEKTGTPYAYTYNNPIMLVDPDGREGTDWFWDSKKKTFTYDASLTSEAQFNRLKEQGLVEGKYLGKDGNFNVVLGNEIIGSVSLQADGSWTNMSDSNQNNWEYHSAGDTDRTRTQYFTNIDSSRNWGVHILGKPFTVGLGGEATVGAGGGIEIGYFSGNYDGGFYLNLYKSAGYSIGIGGAYNEYTSQNGYAPLTTGNFSGNYWNVQGGIGPISGNYGQTATDADGRNVSMGGASVSSGILNFIKRPKLSVGGSVQSGKTFINPSKTIKENDK